MSVRRVVAGVGLCVAAAVGALVASQAASETEGIPAPGSATAPPRGLTRFFGSPAVPEMVGDLGLEEHVAGAVVLEEDPAGFILLYPSGSDPIEVAAVWSTALTEHGYQRWTDHSRPGRTVLRFSDGNDPVLLGAGRTVDAAFVAVSRSDRPTSHWLVQSDEEAPAALRSLLPPPPAPEDTDPTRVR